MTYKCPDCGNGINFNHQGCDINKMTNDDKQSAFPCCGNPETDHMVRGMDLRDWFAGMALQGVLYMVTHGKHKLHPHGEVGLSKECYKIADAMMEARKK